MIAIQGYAVSDVIAEDRHAVLVRAKNGDRSMLLRSPAEEYPTAEDLTRMSYGADMARSLDLPGVLRVLEIERRPPGVLVIMEDFGGRTLRSLLDERRLGVAEALGIALELARTLGELHRRRVVHKDLEPANILVEAGAAGAHAVKITSFDIASRLSRDNPDARNVRRLEGNLAYISPEQTGRMNRSVDYRTDFYSLGVTLYEMLTGRVPFVAADPLTLVYDHIAVPPVPAHEIEPAVPRPVSALVQKLLAKNAEDRYQSAYGLASDLRRCLDQLEGTGAVADFTPGEHDTPATFRLPQKLYGRERETATLVAAFERASVGPSELVLVAGYSGVGKSALVHEIHRPIVKNRGSFVAGKFDQLQNAPYSALIQAFRELMRELLTGTADEVEALRLRLVEALGGVGQVIVDVLPEVERVVGPQPPVAALGPAEAQNRFNLVFRQFVGVIAREDHPIALFLDDLQWADSASLALIQLLLDGTRNLLVIGAYRDNEVHGAHPLLVALEEIKKTGARMGEVALAPLGLADVTHLVADTCGGSDGGAVRGLAELVFRKTAGNPFFVNQFLTSLHDRELLTFDPSAGAWRWSLDRIEAEGITENVAHMMAERLGRLPGDAQQALELAACIGNTFDLATLAVVSQRAPREAALALVEPVEQGLVLPIGDDHKYVAAGAAPDGAAKVRYRFLHDRVQEAAYAQISAASRKEVHLRVGRLLLAGTPDDALEARIFDIVNQLDMSVDLIDDPAERERLARLNLVAGTRAKASTAYPSARGYLRTGLDLLGPAGRELRTDLAFALSREGAECDYLLGHFDEAEAAFDRLLREARSRDDEHSLYTLKLMLYMSRGKHDEAGRMGLAALRLYGIDVDPDADLAAACMAEVVKVGGQLAGRSAREIIHMPEASDPADRTLTRLLFQAMNGVYTNPLLFQLLSAKMVGLALERGNAPCSSLGYVTYAMGVGVVGGDWARAYELGDAGLALGERLDDIGGRGLSAFYFGAFVSPWRAAYRKSFALLDKAYVECLESGALFMAAVAALIRTMWGFHGGEELGGFCQRSHELFEFLRRTRQFDQAYIIAAQLLAARSLVRGPRAEEDQHLSVPAILEKLAHFPNGQCSASVGLLAAAVIQRDWANAVAYEETARATIATAFGLVTQVELLFLQSILLLSLPEGAPEEQERRAKQVAENQDKLLRWAEGCPENFLHEHLLVEAERARVAGDDRAAVDLYDRAVDAAARGERIQIQALASELAGRFYLARGRRRIAGTYLADARTLYERWGALGKAAALEAEHRDVLPREGRGEGGATALDLGSVLKASQAISRAIVLQDLLRTLMRTLIENAGARRGVLVLTGEGETVVTAHGDDAITVDHAPFAGRADLAVSVVRYVERTRETVVLGDAAHAGAFRADPYVTRTGTKSILCMPVILQNKLVGVLYLENDLVAFAFTPERCAVLSMLSAQAAISLENARLYDTLENRVRERTQELNLRNDELSQALARLHQTQKQLVVQEKLASLGALTSGIAHEIKNPLNFVNNFAEASVGLADELCAEVAAQRGRLGRDAAEAIEQLAGDLKQNAGRISEHGRRADGIVTAMLDHARLGSGDRRETDLNALVRDYTALARRGLRPREDAEEVAVDAAYDERAGTVLVSGQDIGRVIINLVNNALYAAQQQRRLTPGMEPRVRVSTHDMGERVEVRVRDNGVGIPAAVRDKIFTPFFTTKPPGEGTGLGLSISHDIVVQGHGGELRFESQEGEGTEFVIILPRGGA